jgi:hypothetical protein
VVWSTLVRAQVRLRYLGNTNGGYWSSILIVVPVLAPRSTRSSGTVAFSVYLWEGCSFPLSFVFEGRPLMSMPRFVLPLFPAFWAMAELAGRWKVPRWAVAGVGAAGLGLFVVLFVNWYYIF